MVCKRPGNRPNLLLINCDDLGYGDLGCYGSDVHRTPFLDQLASQGVLFTDFYMASPICSPSRGAMMTGCYPPRIGFGAFDGGAGVLFPGFATGLNPSELTLAAMLKRQGYATKLVGKWHCGDQPEFLPTRHGFDSYYGLPYSNDMGRRVGGRPDDVPLPLMRDDDVIQLQPDQSSLTERYVEECVSFLRDNHDRPFFLYLAHMHVHLPHYPPECFLKTSRNGRYGAAVECIDWSVGVLCRELQTLGIDNETLVVFTSDNGSRVQGQGGSNAPLRGTKLTTWEGGMRVPCIMRWTGAIPPGKSCTALATAMDLLPTLAALTGASLPDDRIIDGRDIRALMTEPDRSVSPHDAFFYYLQNNLEAVRCGDWKLFVSRGGQPVRELYNLADDIGESRNLAARHSDIVHALQQTAQRCREDTGDAVTGSVGANCRPSGRVENPRPLAQYDPGHPYIIAMYDLTDTG